MDPDAYLTAIEREAGDFTAVLRGDASTPVLSCPGWSLGDLAVHLGVIHRWATQMVESGATEPVRDRDVLFAIDPNSPRLVEWFATGARELVQTLASTPLERPVWSWVPNSTAGFWRRRQAHETAVHRWDAQAAMAKPRPIEAALASDGVDEWLTVFALSRSRARSRQTGAGETFHFHCTDIDGEWIVRFDGPGVQVRAEHGKADVALRGGASDLLLFLWGRRGAEALEILGDESLLSRWPELLPAV